MTRPAAPLGGDPAAGTNPARHSPWPAVLFGALVCVCAVVVGMSLRASEVRSLDTSTQAALRAVTTEVQRRLVEHLGWLERFAHVWERRGELPQSEFEAAAAELAADLESLEAVGWVDPDFRLRFLAPLEGNEAVLGFDLAASPENRAILEHGRDASEVVVMRPIPGVSGAGGIGFTVHVPIRTRGEFGGFISSIYEVRRSLSGLVENLVPGYEVVVTYEGAALLRHVDEERAPPLTRVGHTRVRDVDWTIAVSPGPAIVSTYRTWLPLLVVVAGSVFGIGFGATVHASRSRRIRNRQLRAEVERRRVVEQELQTVVAALPDHVWSSRVTREGYEPLYFSPIIERITGHPQETFLDHPERWFETVHDADRDRVRRTHADLLRGKRDHFSIEYRITTADGETRWLRERVRSTPLEDGARRLDGVTSDITEIKRAEEERLHLETTVQQAQKLESLGVLAGGIAHDFNNLLVGVLGNARLALDDLPEGSPVRPYIGRVERAARRAAELCRQMLAYAGQGVIEAVPLDLRELVEEVRELLEVSTSKKVAATYSFEAGLPRVEADASQIRQVVLNLITNASEAIGSREGAIEIRGRAVFCTREDLDALEMGEVLAPGPYVAVSVHDDGCGMDAETQRRFLEPFFSTKFSGRGLGLAAVQGIVRRHRGAILVRSEVGEGTTITLYFPALSENEPRSAAPCAKADARPREWVPRGTVLLVDDEEDARELGSTVLERAGFEVRTAVDGVDGVETLRGNRNEIACVLLDLTMPRLDGAEALAAIRQIRPDVPVILCSGYPERESLARFEGLGLDGFLQKPYSPEALLLALRQALEAR